MEPSVHAEPTDVTNPPATEVGSTPLAVTVLPLADPVVASRIRRGQDHGPDPFRPQRGTGLAASPAAAQQ